MAVYPYKCKFKTVTVSDFIILTIMEIKLVIEETDDEDIRKNCKLFFKVDKKATAFDKAKMDFFQAKVIYF